MFDIAIEAPQDYDKKLLDELYRDVEQLQSLRSLIDSLPDGLYDSIVQDDGEMIDRIEELISATSQVIQTLEIEKLEEYNRRSK